MVISTKQSFKIPKLSQSDFDITTLSPLLKKGADGAFKKIFDHYERKIYSFIFSMVKSEYVAEDILQDVFVKVWLKRAILNPSLSFDSFIYTIARNLTYNHLRNVASQEALKNELWCNLSVISQETENALLSAEYEDIVNDILLNLPAQKRSIFILSKQQGRNNQEIADLLGITPKTVKNHLWKTLKLIRAQLQPYLSDNFVLLFIIGYLLN